jgi:hypothetical protein
MPCLLFWLNCCIVAGCTHREGHHAETWIKTIASMPLLALQNAKCYNNSKEKLYQVTCTIEHEPIRFIILPFAILISQTKDDTMFHAQSWFRLPCTCTTNLITNFVLEGVSNTLKTKLITRGDLNQLIKCELKLTWWFAITASIKSVKKLAYLSAPLLSK